MFMTKVKEVLRRRFLWSYVSYTIYSNMHLKHLVIST